MKILITALAAMLLFTGCDKNSKESATDLKHKLVVEDERTEKPIADIADYAADTTRTPPPGEPQKKKQPIASQPAANPDWDKKIIKNATLNMEVKDYNAFSTSFREKVKGLGGYVAQEEQNQSDYKIENTLVIKVPVDQFDNAVILLTANAEKVNERKITSQDVTTEFVDTKSRIEAKKQVRQRYMELLNQAKNMEDILSVQSEINGVQEQIESATGRINYLGQAAAYSTISLTYYQVLNATASKDETPKLGAKIGNAFKTGLSWVTDLFVGLVSIWPLFIVVFGLIILYKRTKTVKPKETA